jgi:predicted Zn finger-like uncharacterized protein
VNFACDRCAKRYTLDDAKVPTRGFRVTCKECGHAFVVQPPTPMPTPPPVRPPPTAAAPAPADEHERFFNSPVDSGQPAPSGQQLPSPGGHLPNRLRAIAAGAFVIVGLVVGGAWLAGPPGGAIAVPGGAREPRSGRLDGQAEEPLPSAQVGPAQAPANPPEPPPALPVQRRAGPAIPGGGPARIGPATSSQDHRGRVGASIGTRDRRLLDLLGRKQDAPGVSAPEAEELSTGRASLQEATVRGALAANSSAFSACIARAGKADPGLRLGKDPLVMELLVQPSGLVSQATMQDPRYAQAALGQCLVAAARRMVFPSFEGEQILVQAPLRLSAVR